MEAKNVFSELVETILNVVIVDRDRQEVRKRKLFASRVGQDGDTIASWRHTLTTATTDNWNPTK